ncbi:unnamed protein product [Auanema sp. JU1783]|nr:unnamed protein product [Auanema sp. JU1783]
MRNINICLIALASILFLLINLYGLLEILRYFKLKQLKDLQERLKESRIRGENNWHTVFTSTSLYEISREADETTKSHRPNIEFLPRSSKKPPIPFIETSTTTSTSHTTTRAHVTTQKDVEPPTIKSIITTYTTRPTIFVTNSSEIEKTTSGIPETSTSTPRILITTKPDWFLDSRQLEDQRRQNAERRRQQLIREENERRFREEEETKKRLEHEIEERKQNEQEERDRIHKLGEERRRKEHAEKMEERRLQAIEEARRQMLLRQEHERIEIEARRRSDLEKKKLEEKQKEELEKLRLKEQQELIRKQKLEIEQRRLAEQQHREREKLREELRQIEHLRRQKLEENAIEEKLLETEDREDEGKTIEMSLEEEDDMELDEDYGVRATTPLAHKNVESHVNHSREPYHVEENWSLGRHRPTTTSSPKDSVETPEPPRNEEVTIVTAFLDIGRGEWFHYQRPLEKYHEFMENLLSLKNNMVIFTDKSSYDFVHKYRKNLGLMPMTKIHMIQFDDLPLSRHLPYAQKIIEDEMNNDELYLEDPDMKNHPEAKSAEYDIVVNSKTYFLYNTTMEDPFDTDFFVWIDAGYGHGNQNVYPYDNVWQPKFSRNKISMIKLTPEHDPISKYKIDNLYRRNWSVMSGGFIAGDKRSIGQLYTITHNKFVHLIYQNKVDDDQTVMVLAINAYPHLFEIKQGDWFDAFRLYSDPETPFGAKNK